MASESIFDFCVRQPLFVVDVLVQELLGLVLLSRRHLDGILVGLQRFLDDLS